MAKLLGSQRCSGSVCEYLVFVRGVAQFIMYARVRTKYEDALWILNKHKGYSLLREEIHVRSKSQVSIKLWNTFVERRRGGKWYNRIGE